MVTLRHESDVDMWGGPDRDYYTFVVISVLSGLVGGDHIYLRSFKTAFFKAFVNLFTFGSWYWWDLSQILFQRETILKEGLASPLDWIRNIGRGVFVTPENPVEYVSRKSYILYTLCTVFLGLLAADKFYMGDYISGIAKAILCLNIFTFLIGWIWAGWDAWNAVFSEREILEKGIPPPPGLGFVLPHANGEVFKLRPKKEGEAAILEPYLDMVGLSWDGGSEGLGAWIQWILCFFRGKKEPNCAPRTFKPPIPAATVSAAATAPATAPATAATAATAAPVSATAAPEVSAIPKEEAANQKGGFRGGEVLSSSSDGNNGNNGNPGMVVAGALTAIVIAAGLKSSYDFISRQYE